MNTLARASRDICRNVDEGLVGCLLAAVAVYPFVDLDSPEAAIDGTRHRPVAASERARARYCSSRSARIPTGAADEVM